MKRAVSAGRDAGRAAHQRPARARRVDRGQGRARDAQRRDARGARRGSAARARHSQRLRASMWTWTSSMRWSRRSTRAWSVETGETVRRRLCPLGARDARACPRRWVAGRWRVAGRGRVRGRVRARGPAPQSAAEQGPSRGGGRYRARTGADAPESDSTPAPRPHERRAFRYVRWDGRQRLDELNADDLLAVLSDDLLAEST